MECNRVKLQMQMLRVQMKEQGVRINKQIEQVLQRNE
jgi:hypothetical protein